MLRIALAAYALCAALLLSIGVLASTTAEAGDYGDDYYRGHHHGYHGGVIRTGYYGGGAYYGGHGYHGGHGYYGGGGYYDRGYYDTSYYDGGYYGGGYGYSSCHTVYIPYGWTWYRATSC